MTGAAQIASTLGWVALVAYALSAVLYTTSLFRTAAWVGRSATAFAVLGAACNFGTIFALHVTLNMLAYAAFAVACALSLLYVVVGRSLKKRAFTGPASRLPSLSYLERANRTSLSLGILSLTVGVLLGLFWASRMWRGEHPLWALDPKIWFALATLAFYVFVLVRAHRGAAPVSTARLSIAGFVLVLLSYTAVNLLVSKLHDFTS